MAPKSAQVPALFCLMVFLSANYLIGFEIGSYLTGSTIVALVIASVTPCLSLLGIALLGSRPHVSETATLEEA